MLRYAAGRLGQALVSILGVLTIVFVVMRFAGDPTLLLVPPGASQAQVDLLRHELGFDQPILTQYADYLWSLLHLDFGVSVVQQIPASEIVMSRFPYTMLLAAGAFLVAVGMGVPVGIAMALWRGRFLARVLGAVVIAGQSMPTFLSGLLMMFVFAVWLGWLPTSGVDGAGSLVMPSLALGGLAMSTFARMTRISILDELSKDYVRAGRARGLSRAKVVALHVLRNASIPVVTVTALEIGNLLAGAVIVETVFAWPGIGQLAIQSIQSRDFLVVQTITLLISAIYVTVSLLADLAYAVIDPRISHRS
jgi:peptide/nickel transport system permease protein